MTPRRDIVTLCEMSQMERRQKTVSRERERETLEFLLSILQPSGTDLQLMGRIRTHRLRRHGDRGK